MNQHYPFKQTCLFLILLLFAAGCAKDEEPLVFPPTLTTSNVQNLTRFGATLQGNAVKNPQSITECEIGFMYATSPSLADASTVPSTGSEGSLYSTSISQLSPGKKYYYCIYAKSGNTTIKGEVLTFNTSEAVTPALSVTAIGETTEKTVVLSSGLIDNGGYEPSLRGFAYCFYTEAGAEPTVDDQTQLVSDFTTEGFTVTVNELEPNTTYMVRAYAINEVGIGYGESTMFTTNTLKIPVVIGNGSGKLENVPVAPTAYEAEVAGAVTDEQGFAVTERGFCYSAESRMPTIEGQHVLASTGNNSQFNGTLTALSANTKYYLRAYATNAKGTGYSSTIEFTSQKEQLVALTQIGVTGITSAGAIVTAQLSAEEGTTITGKGICYGTAQLPAVNGTHVEDNNPGNKVSGTLSGLTEGIAYYARAYAITRDGTFYSGEISFNTETTFAPTIGKPTIYDVTETGVKARAVISTNGGLDITAKGVCYSSNNSQPTIEDNHILSTETGNNITATLTALSGGVKYYMRAYATNAKGTAYSSVVNFGTTQHTTPKLNSLNVLNIGDDNAQALANIADLGGTGEVITERGFVIANYSTPTIENNTFKAVSTQTTNSFKATLTGMQYNTSYYIRAYATNAVGTGYSASISFQTGSSTTPSVEELSLIKAEKNALQVSYRFSNNGNATVTEYGFCYIQGSGWPDLENSKHITATLEGATVAGTITGLTHNTAYTVRGYATNKNGTTYTSTQQYSTTKLPPNPDDNLPPGEDDATKRPSVSYTNVSNYQATSVLLSASINSDGNLPITEKGFCWVTADKDTPTVETNKILITTAGKEMKHKLTGLTGGTAYRVRAYAINSKGISYGSEARFTTEAADKPGPGEDDNPTPNPTTRSRK